MELVFYSLDNDNNKVFFRTEYKRINNQIIFLDKSLENTTIYLTINGNSLVFERKGNTSMNMSLKEGFISKGHYENSTGLFFDFETKTKSLSIKDNCIEIEYSLFVLSDEISSHKIWITLN